VNGIARAELPGELRGREPRRQRQRSPRELDVALRHPGSYTAFKNLTLGVKKVFDTNPPQTNQNLTFHGGYDPNYYDARALFVYGTLRYAFK
jgi:hypothetical protein